MNTGKLAPRNDPRMPDHAPEHAIDSTHKPMPELPLDTKELRYPPQDQLTGEDNTPLAPKPTEAPAEALSEVPRHAPPIAPPHIEKALAAIAGCIVACEALLELGPGVSTHAAEQASFAALCAETCRLTERYLEHAQQRELTPLVREAGLLCARMCETCALACERHAPDAIHTRVSMACRACAEACRGLDA